MNNLEFQQFLVEKGCELYRPMPWREDTRPYYVLVSELMLQQTQVNRVIPKFEAFISRFPDERSLAAASLSDVITLWQGLGYNRRAKFLHDAAKMIVTDFDGVFPHEMQNIIKLPGVGKNTAGAIMAYAFNQPVLYVETNIRTVYIHHYFKNNVEVGDKEILEKLKDTAPWNKGKEQPDKFSHKFDGAMRKTEGLSHFRPREFYWALMDYGSWLKANGVRNNAQSKLYKKQSKLEGSLRQMRGIILKELSSRDIQSIELVQLFGSDERFEPALAGLLHDGLVQRVDGMVHLTK